MLNRWNKLVVCLTLLIVASTATFASPLRPTVAEKGIISRPPVNHAVYDFDGDGKTDYVIARTANAFEWYIYGSLTGFSGRQFGFPGPDVPVPADYDGDGKWDITVWRNQTPAYFFILRSSDNTLLSIPFGQTSDDPLITQDFDGDGRADPAVTRSANGVKNWYILRSTLGFTAVVFGLSGGVDAPIRGDFDGDGKADFAVYRHSTPNLGNTFIVLHSSDGVVQYQNWGNWNTDNIVPGDFDGDGKTDCAIFREEPAPDSGYWYWVRSSDGVAQGLLFGVSGSDRPVPGDYDGDGKTDQAVWRQTTPSTFYVNGSLIGFTAFTFGLSTDLPPTFSSQVR